MPTGHRTSLFWVASIAILAGVGAVFISRAIWPLKPPVVVKPATTTATTVAIVATAPATTQAAAPPRTLLDVVHRHLTTYATTQPLPGWEVLAFHECGHFILREPVYLDTFGHLWITRPDADDTQTVLQRSARETTHITRERVLYVHRMFDPSGAMRGMVLICQGRGVNVFEALQGEERTQFAGRSTGYDWGRALFWNNRIAVPTDSGASVFAFGDSVTETPSPALLKGTGPHPPSQLAADADQVFAWIPPGKGFGGSRGAVRFAEDKWSPLGPEQKWPKTLVDLLLLNDGTILQLVPDDNQDDDNDASFNPAKAGDMADPLPFAGDDVKVKLAMRSMTATHLDEKKIMKLINRLSASDPDVRKAANAELTTFGVGLWPILERELANSEEDPEKKRALTRLLNEKVAPTLGGMSLVDGRLKRVTRDRDGNALYYADAGVSVPQPDGGDPRITAPVWLSHPALQPTHDSLAALFGTLSEGMVRDLEPGKFVFSAIEGEWIVGDEVRGPARYSGVDFFPLLPKKEHSFCKVVGKDAAGRWLFRKPIRANAAAPAATTPSATTTSATQSAGAGDAASELVETLIVDPRLPDPTPRLPVWEVELQQTIAGWDKDNWPAVKFGGAWTLREKEWQVLDEQKEKMLTAAGEVPPPATQAHVDATQATTVSATTRVPTVTTTTQSAATQSAAAVVLPDGSPILVDSDGTRYYDGQNTLTVFDRTGRETVWPLPERAIGTGKVTLLKTKDGVLFLFNVAGRVVRLRATPEGPEPFMLEAVFSRHLPATADPTRIWLDPAGRIDIVYEGKKLSILFPEGRVPKDIAEKMPAQAGEEEE